VPEFAAFHRRDGQLEIVDTQGGVVSPLLGVRFEVVEGSLQCWGPDGRQFLTMTAMDQARADAEARAEI